MSKRFQTVGSLLRPSALLQYKKQIERRDDIVYPFYADFAGYEECEAQATKDVVEKEIQHGLAVLTDGEYSKSMWHLDFVWGLKGVVRYIAEHGYFFRDKDETQKYETRRDIGLRIIEPLGGKNHHFIAIFQRLKSIVDGGKTKLCVPSPSHIFGELSWSDNIGGKDSVYASPQELKTGLVKAYKEFIEEYAAAGGKILQLDDCLWEIFADDNPNSPYTGENINQDTVRALAAEFIDINNTIIDFGHSLGLAMWTHNCRGNYDSRNMGGGSYVKIAELFLKQLKYDRFFLEWDDDRAGSLDALAAFKDKQETEIVLGLLSSKTNTLDDESRVIHMLDEASKIIPKDRLLLSHQCGFASCDGGNELSEDEQWAKIDQGQRIASSYWSE
ncbi:MAG: cobalamin-independent methionine synthase II family protein [Treponema sp.]|jgi:methionine synthase II (cobalamin-independent)|nr:cobalamin-independent methionine synthase II family protein [Treponema sp.]